LKLPISRGVVGSLRQLLGKSLSALIDGQIHGVFRIPGILSSTRLAERTTPKPEGFAIGRTAGWPTTCLETAARPCVPPTTARPWHRATTLSIARQENSDD